jgi:hypothetical protein
LTKEELPEYWNYNMWHIAMGCISYMLDKTCPYDSEYQIRMCQSFIENKEFKKWFQASVPDNCHNPILDAFRDGDFRKAYPYLVELYDESDIPKVSVVVIINRIDKCINSLLNQTLDKIEIIKAREGDRTSAVKSAKGKYILFCDGNDFVQPTWCDVMYELALNNPQAWICTGYCLADNDGNIYDKVKYSDDEKISLIRENNYGILLNTQIFDREILIEKNYNLEDDSFVLSYRNEKQYGICDNQEPFYCHRVSNINGGKENED